MVKDAKSHANVKKAEEPNGKELVIGSRVYSDLGGPDQKQGWFSWIVAVTTMTIYCGWMNILLLLCIAAIFNPWIRYLVVAIWSTVLLPAKPVLWRKWNQLWVFKTWRQYFKFSYCFEVSLDPKKRYILYEAPHGTFPIGAITAGTMCQTFFPESPIYSVAATSVFHVPFWRHFITWIGSLPATKANFKRLLSHGSVAVVVGGIAEMYMCHPRKERIKLAGRKGFIRIALEEQVDGIVPVYYFGQTRVLDFGPAWLQGVSRKIRVSLGVLHGRWGLPLPRQVPIYMVHGAPIPVPKVARDDPGFEAAVDALLGEALKGMQELYDRHRAEYGWADRPLSIE